MVVKLMAPTILFATKKRLAMSDEELNNVLVGTSSQFIGFPKIQVQKTVVVQGSHHNQSLATPRIDMEDFNVDRTKQPSSDTGDFSQTIDSRSSSSCERENSPDNNEPIIKKVIFVTLEDFSDVDRLNQADSVTGDLSQRESERSPSYEHENYPIKNESTTVFESSGNKDNSARVCKRRKSAAYGRKAMSKRAKMRKELADYIDDRNSFDSNLMECFNESLQRCQQDFIMSANLIQRQLQSSAESIGQSMKKLIIDRSSADRSLMNLCRAIYEPESFDED